MPRTRVRPSDLDNLTRSQLVRLNDAFDAAAAEAYGQRPDRPSPAKKQRMEIMQEESGGGGFIVDDGEGGGSLPDLVGKSQARSDAVVTVHERIPLNFIPSVLDSLGLASDPQVLGIFEHVLDSDSEQESEEEERRPPNRDTVSREHFLQVCAVLMGDDDQSEGENDKTKKGAEKKGDYREDSNSSGDSSSAEDTYKEENEETSTATRKPVTRATRFKAKKGKQPATFDDDEELTDIEEDEQGITAATKTPSSATKSSNKGKGKAKGKATIGKELTADQKRNVSRTFAQFFPDGQPQNTAEKTIGLENIKHVAKLINFSLTDAEINEMLEQASTGSNMRVNLSDFEQVMRK